MKDVLAVLGAEHAGTYAPLLEAACPRHHIEAPRRVAAFLANILHESGHFARLVENLNYRADKLVGVFGAHRIDAATAARIGRKDPHQKANQEAIANAVYGGAWGRENLGNTEAGDGWRFRGRGLMQLTGRDNYARFAKVIGAQLDSLPALLETPKGAVESAAHFFEAKCLKAADADDIRQVRLLINGGDKGLPEVRTLYEKAKAALGAH